MSPSLRPMLDVAVVGGGPVGLYLAGLLLQNGISVRVFEQRTERSTHSRAIGIHPPALQALAQLGCAEKLIQQGVAIRSGRALSNGQELATVDFSALRSPYPFVLSSPQAVTEAVLEERVLTLDGAALRRGARVTAYRPGDGCIDVSVVDAAAGRSQQEEQVSARWCIVAAGARSSLPSTRVGARRGRQRVYGDSYVMGDFADATDLGSEAVLFMEKEGIVESFPLPGNVRRWVAWVDAHKQDRSADWLAGVVKARTGMEPDVSSCSMVSSFWVRSSILPRFLVDARIAVIGDAAHEVSPIGGQGMNLGWLDAAELSPIISRSLEGTATKAACRSFERVRGRAARRAAFQSEINMMLGRPVSDPVLALRNNLLSRAAGAPALNRFIAHRFTMQ